MGGAGSSPDGAGTDGGGRPGPDAGGGADSGSDAGTRIIVHVAGAVASPGIVRLGAARVFEAIEAAGGARKEAQLEALNLAAPLTDGQQVYVPTPDEAGPPPVPGAGSSGVAVAPAEPERGAAAPQTVPPARSTSTRPLPRNSRNCPAWGRCWPGGSSSSANSTAPTGNRLRLDAVPGIGPVMLETLVELVTV